MAPVGWLLFVVIVTTIDVSSTGTLHRYSEETRRRLFAGRDGSQEGTSDGTNHLVHHRPTTDDIVQVSEAFDDVDYTRSWIGKRLVTKGVEVTGIRADDSESKSAEDTYSVSESDVSVMKGEGSHEMSVGASGSASERDNKTSSINTPTSVRNIDTTNSSTASDISVTSAGDASPKSSEATRIIIGGGVSHALVERISELSGNESGLKMSAEDIKIKIGHGVSYEPEGGSRGMSRAGNSTPGAEVNTLSAGADDISNGGSNVILEGDNHIVTNDSISAASKDVKNIIGGGVSYAPEEESNGMSDNGEPSASKSDTKLISGDGVSSSTSSGDVKIMIGDGVSYVPDGDREEQSAKGVSFVSEDDIKTVIGVGVSYAPGEDNEMSAKASNTSSGKDIKIMKGDGVSYKPEGDSPYNNDSLAIGTPLKIVVKENISSAAEKSTDISADGNSNVSEGTTKIALNIYGGETVISLDKSAEKLDDDSNTASSKNITILPSDDISNDNLSASTRELKINRGDEVSYEREGNNRRGSADDSGSKSGRAVHIMIKPDGSQMPWVMGDPIPDEGPITLIGSDIFAPSGSDNDEIGGDNRRRSADDSGSKSGRAVHVMIKPDGSQVPWVRGDPIPDGPITLIGGDIFAPSGSDNGEIGGDNRRRSADDSGSKSGRAVHVMIKPDGSQVPWVRGDPIPDGPITLIGGDIFAPSGSDNGEIGGDNRRRSADDSGSKSGRAVHVMIKPDGSQVPWVRGDPIPDGPITLIGGDIFAPSGSDNGEIGGDNRRRSADDSGSKSGRAVHVMIKPDGSQVPWVRGDPIPDGPITLIGGDIFAPSGSDNGEIGGDNRRRSADDSGSKSGRAVHVMIKPDGSQVPWVRGDPIPDGPITLIGGDIFAPSGSDNGEIGGDNRRRSADDSGSKSGRAVHVMIKPDGSQVPWVRGDPIPDGPITLIGGGIFAPSGSDNGEIGGDNRRRSADDSGSKSGRAVHVMIKPDGSQVPWVRGDPIPDGPITLIGGDIFAPSGSDNGEIGGDNRRRSADDSGSKSGRAVHVMIKPDGSQVPWVRGDPIPDGPITLIGGDIFAPSGSDNGEIGGDNRRRSADDSGSKSGRAVHVMIKPDGSQVPWVRGDPIPDGPITLIGGDIFAPSGSDNGEIGGDNRRRSADDSGSKSGRAVHVMIKPDGSHVPWVRGDPIPDGPITLIGGDIFAPSGSDNGEIGGGTKN